MTIFGPDISSYQHGLNIAALTDPFVLVKITEGTYYRDPDWPRFRDAVRAAGKILVGYHFVTGEDPARQVTTLASWIGDRSIPVMWDFEPTGSSRPDLPRLLAVDAAARAAGLRPRLAYFPRWYWQQLGSPDLSPLNSRGLGVVSSNYPNPSIPDPVRDYAADGGDRGPGWASYGGITPLLWQFTDAGVEQQKMDFNAFRGSVAELATFLGSTTPTSGGSSMAVLDNSDARTVWGYSNGDKPDVHQTLANAANWAGSANAKLDAVLAHFNMPAPSVDVQGLAAALGPLLHPTTDVDAIVAALVPHVGAPDPAAFAAELVQHIEVSTK